MAGCTADPPSDLRKGSVDGTALEANKEPRGTNGGGGEIRGPYKSHSANG